MNTMLGRNFAGEDTGAGGGTDRRSAEEVRESDTLRGKPIEVRGPDFPVTCAPKCPRALIIREKKQDVRTIYSHGISLPTDSWR